MPTITKTITQPDEVILDFAKNLGYRDEIPNPDYVPAIGSPMMEDPSGATTTDPDTGDILPALIPNPDYVAAVGNPTIPNPESALTYVSDRFDEMVTDWLTQFAAKQAKIDAENAAAVAVAATKEAIKATITTT